jgi:hypothetical protein
MGYRSQVVLAVSKEVLPQFLTTLARSSEAKELCFVHADKKIDNYDERGGFLFMWDHIKWYDSYECVAAICDFMDWCDGESASVPVSEEQKAQDKSPTPVTHMDGDECYRFVRTGEEMDDNEERGYGFTDIYISRSIDF